MRFIIAFTIALSLVITAARADERDCWARFDAAITHSAQAPLPPYMTYDIARTITHPQVLAPSLDRISVLLRTKDGMASVNDSDFAGTIVTDNPHPGAPFLGPYGERREIWLEANGLTAGSDKAIAVVRSHPARACALSEETIDGTPVEHLVITPFHPDLPGIREVWVDGKNQFREAIVAEYADPRGALSTSGDLVPVRVETQQIGPYLLVRRLSYVTPTSYHVSYAFTGYTFSATAPSGTFAAGK